MSRRVRSSNVANRRGVPKGWAMARWVSGCRLGAAHYAIDQLRGLQPRRLGYFDEIEHIDLALAGLDAPNEVIGPLQFGRKLPLSQARRLACLDNRGNQCAMSRAA